MATPFSAGMDGHAREPEPGSIAGSSKPASSHQNQRHAAGPVTYKDYASRVPHHPQSPPAGAAVSPRRSAPPIPERSVAAPVDMNALDTKSPPRSRGGTGSNDPPQPEDHPILNSTAKREKRETGKANDEGRDPPANWEALGPALPKLRVASDPESDVDANPSHGEVGEPIDRRDDEEKESLSIPSLGRRQLQSTGTRQTNPALTICTTTPPTPTDQSVPSPSESNRFPYIPSEDRAMTMSPAPSFTVNTERDGKKVVSQAEMSELIRSSIVKARKQAAASNPPGGGHQLPRATVVEIDPSALRSNLRSALIQQTIGKPPQGPFPWSPILNAHAFSPNPLLQQNHLDLDMASVGEWTEPSQLTEPSALLAMNDHIRYLQSQRGLRPGSFFVSDRDELYEEVTDRQQAKRLGEGGVVPTKKSPHAHSKSKRLPPESSSKSELGTGTTGDVVNVPGTTTDKDKKDDAHEEPVKKLSLPPIDTIKREAEDISMVPHATPDTESGGTKSDDQVKKRQPRDPTGHDADKVGSDDFSSNTPSKRSNGKSVEQQVAVGGPIAEDLLRNDIPDTIESLRHLRHTLSPRSGEKPESNEEALSKHEVQSDDGEPHLMEAKLDSSAAEKKTEANEMSRMKDDNPDGKNTSGDLNAAIDIMSDQDIEKIVSNSMHKAKKTAEKEVQELLQESRRRKDNIVVKTNEGDKVLSKAEVADLIKESMARARETAQKEIAEMVKDSIRLARESAKEEIRAIVEESMMRARESTQREMQEFVKDSFQKARRSDGSAVSVASSQGFTTADFTLGSFPTRQPSFGSTNAQIRGAAHGGHHLEHLSPLSEEEQNFNAEALETSFCEPNDKASERVQTESPTLASNRSKQAPESDGGDEDAKYGNCKSQSDAEGPEGYGMARDEDDIDSSLMVLKNCTSPDVFHGLEETEKREASVFWEDKSTAHRSKTPTSLARQTKRALLEPEEEQLVEVRSEKAFSHHDSMNDAPTEPSGGKDSILSRSVGQEPSVSLQDAEKSKDAADSISETLRGFDKNKQKRIEDAALTLLSPSDRSRLSNDRRRTGSNKRVETIVVTHKPKRQSSSRDHARSRSSQESEKWSRDDYAHQSDKASRRSDSERSSRKSSDRTSQKSSHSKRSQGSGRSRTSNTQSCAAESVVTKEFLARLSTPQANLKDLMTPKVQNLASHAGDADEDREAHDRGGIKRTGSKDSAVTVPGNTFCLQFLTLLVNGGAGAESVADSSGGASALPGSKEVEASGSPDPPPAETTPGGGLAALNPAAMFNQGSNWIDSLAQDMSSVLEGNDSTDIDTEGDTTFDDHDMSSYSQTDGEAEGQEEEFEFVMSNDDNSYNAGWWTDRRQGTRDKRSAEKKPWRKRRDPGPSLLD